MIIAQLSLGTFIQVAFEIRPWLLHSFQVHLSFYPCTLDSLCVYTTGRIEVLLGMIRTPVEEAVLVKRSITGPFIVHNRVAFFKIFANELD